MVNHPNRKRALKTSAAASLPVHNHDEDYAAFLATVKTMFAANASKPLFTTDAEGLWAAYLDNLPAERQVHDCHSCKRFIETYGALAVTGEDGHLVSAVWAAMRVPDFYQASVDAMARIVGRSRVVGQFLAKEPVWGTPHTGTWTHISVAAAPDALHKSRALTPFQAMAAIKENYRTVSTALGELKPAMLDEALRLLTADTLARSEKFVGPVKWLRALHDRPKGRAGENALWHAIALAPEGYCHPKASVIGPLLQDIADGLPFAEIKARFDAKMHPLIYQRPQAAPTAGNVAAAEALVAKLGVAPSLERRFARLDEVEAIWRPGDLPKPATGEGVFGHVKTKGVPSIQPVEMPEVTMTWEKFRRTVLPEAKVIELRVPAHGNFLALVTGLNADAPPILKWDSEERRNPVSGYVYHGGSSAHQWGLTAGRWTEVDAIALHPSQWHGSPMDHLGDRTILILNGCRDSRTGQGNALFPEDLKSDLHGIRSTIEAYSRTAVIAGYDEASACGYDIGNKAAACTLRVRNALGVATYRIDRWD
jgi:hypothetical protein